MVQLSHPYMTTGKTIALTVRTFVSKVMSLLFNTLSNVRFLKVGDATQFWNLKCKKQAHAAEGEEDWVGISKRQDARELDSACMSNLKAFNF